MKQCSVCGESLSESEFDLAGARDNPGRLRGDCRKCAYSKRKAYISANKEKFSTQRKYHLVKYKYGLSSDAYDALLQRSGGKCEICREVFDIPRVDHCHETGFVRGLLCQQCNTGIGMLRDSISNLESAIEYLRTRQ